MADLGKIEIKMGCKKLEKTWLLETFLSSGFSAVANSEATFCYRYYSLFSHSKMSTLQLATGAIRLLVLGGGYQQLFMGFCSYTGPKEWKGVLGCSAGEGESRWTPVSCKNCTSGEVLTLRRIQTHSFCTAFIVILLKTDERSKLRNTRFIIPLGRRSSQANSNMPSSSPKKQIHWLSYCS